MLDLIIWCIPAKGQVVARIGTLLGGAAILGGIIGWLAFDGEDLLDGELIGPGW